MQRVLLLFLCSLITLPGLAQDRGDGTIYSRFGVGDRYAFSSPQVAALGGGSGVSLHGLNYTSFANPASWSDQLLTRAVMGARLEMLRSEDERNEQSELFAGGLNAVHFAFPILDNRLGVGLGFTPFSRTNYHVLESGLQLERPLEETPSNYEVNYEGRGGLQTITVGAGYKLLESLRVGARLDFVFGVLEDAERYTFEGEPIAPINLTTSTRLSGTTATFGILYDRSALLGEDDNLAFGAALSLPTELSGRQFQTLGESLDRDTLFVGARKEIEGDADLPLRLDVGASYRPDARWLLLADLLYAPWGDFSTTFTRARFAESRFGAYHDRLRISGGVEFLPAGDRPSTAFLRHVAYRLGGFYDTGYVDPAPEPGIETYGVTAGLSLPAPVTGTRLDIHVTAGQRGSLSGDLVRDRFVELSLSVNIGERWFQRPLYR